MWIAALFVVLAIVVWAYLDTIKPKHYPPGPKWLPILGCAAEIYKIRKKTRYLYATVNALMAQYQNSPCLGLRIGKDRIVTVNTFQAVKEMLHNEHFDGRPKGIFYETRTWGKRLGVFLTDGDMWKEQKIFLVKHLKEFGLGKKRMGDIAKSEAFQMTNDLTDIVGEKNVNGAVIQLHNFFTVYNLNAVWTMMTGHGYSRNDPQIKVLLEVMAYLVANTDAIGTTFSFFPILCFLAPTLSGYKKFIEYHKHIWKYLRQELANHKANMDPGKEDKDFMDVYIRVLREHGEVNGYSEDQLVALCMDMFLGGTDTTAKSLSFGLCYLVREQDIQKKAQEEIDRVVGRDRYPTLEDKPNMPYNEAIIHESVRHFIGRSLGVPHRALRDTTIAEYVIPKDTTLVTNFANILLNETLYPEPYAFRPERFLKDGKICLPDHYIPFGLGKRRCMGDSLAKCNLFIFITTLLQRFSFLPAPMERLPSLDHIDGTTPSPAPFKALVVPRL